MSFIWVEISIIMLLIFFNGFFAMSEMAVVSARKARLQQLADEGNSKARIALELANAPGSVISTIQIGITLIGILAGTYSGATVATRLSFYLEKISLLAPYRETISLGFVVIVVTYFSLIIGELVPKRIALNNPEQIAIKVAKTMRTLSRISLPVVYLLKASTNAVFLILRIKPSEEPPVTEEEVKILIDQGTRSGVFEEMEQDMVESVFRLADRKVNAIITPRPDIVSLDLDDPPEVNWPKISESHHSNFPVFKSFEDNIVGIISIKTLWAAISAGKPVDLMSFLLKPLFIPEHLPALKLVELLKQSDMHMALVVDEYGAVRGLVTPQDVFKSIVGDLASIHLSDQSRCVQREDGSWLVDGSIPFDEFKATFHISHVPDEGEDQFNTLGGFIMTHIDRIPAVTDHFEWAGLRFEVMDMADRRVDKVLVTPIEEEPE
jgi:putative hemolysin